MVRLQERDPVRLGRFAAAMPVKRLRWCERQHFGHEHVNLAPFEDERPAWTQDTEALSESAAQFFAPPIAKRAVCLAEVSCGIWPDEVRRIEDDVVEVGGQG